MSEKLYFRPEGLWSLGATTGGLAMEFSNDHSFTPREGACANCGADADGAKLCRFCEERCPTMHDDILDEVQRFGLTGGRLRATQTSTRRIDGEPDQRTAANTMHKCPKCEHRHTRSKGYNQRRDKQIRICLNCCGTFRVDSRV